jgi:hypothetical protein
MKSLKYKIRIHKQAAGYCLYSKSKKMWIDIPIISGTYWNIIGTIYYDKHLKCEKVKNDRSFIKNKNKSNN